MVALAEVLDGTDSDWFVGATTRQSGVGQAGPGFTGYITDNETGLLHARARQYSPTLGRFVSRDQLGYVDGYQLYAAYFVPRGVDPTGNGYWECTGSGTGERWRYKKVMVDSLDPMYLTPCQAAAVNAYLDEAIDGLDDAAIDEAKVKCGKDTCKYAWCVNSPAPLSPPGGSYRAVTPVACEMGRYHSVTDITKTPDGATYFDRGAGLGDATVSSACDVVVKIKYAYSCRCPLPDAPE
jgi:RHS repeat-associated protein